LLNFAQGFSPVPSLFGASVPLGFRIAFAYLRYFTTIQPFVNLFLKKAGLSQKIHKSPASLLWRTDSGSPVWAADFGNWS